MLMLGDYFIGGCKANFPNQEIRRTLKADVYDKLIDRQVHVRVWEDLFSCRFCILAYHSVAL